MRIEKRGRGEVGRDDRRGDEEGVTSGCKQREGKERGVERSGVVRQIDECFSSIE